MSNLQIRVLAAFIYFPALLLSAHDTVAFSLAMSFCLAVGWHEYLSFFAKPDSQSDWIKHVFKILVGTLPTLFAAYGGRLLLGLSLVLLAYQAIVIVSLTRRGTLPGVQRELAQDTLGFLYLTGLFSLLVQCQIIAGPQPIWFLFLIVGAVDSGAYFAGRAFGKSPFFQNISPKKTLEGFMGGVVAALAAAILFYYVLSHFEHPIPNLTGCLLLAFLISLVSVFGDLFESLLKRHYGVKDSGKIIPGHGGILDRFDAVIFGAVPLFFYVVLRGGFR